MIKDDVLGKVDEVEKLQFDDFIFPWEGESTNIVEGEILKSIHPDTLSMASPVFGFRRGSGPTVSYDLVMRKYVSHRMGGIICADIFRAFEEPFRMDYEGLADENLANNFAYTGGRLQIPISALEDRIKIGQTKHIGISHPTLLPSVGMARSFFQMQAEFDRLGNVETEGRKKYLKSPDGSSIAVPNRFVAGRPALSPGRIIDWAMAEVAIIKGGEYRYIKEICGIDADGNTYVEIVEDY